MHRRHARAAEHSADATTPPATAISRCCLTLPRHASRLTATCCVRTVLSSRGGPRQHMMPAHACRWTLGIMFVRARRWPSRRSMHFVCCPGCSKASAASGCAGTPFSRRSPRIRHSHSLPNHRLDTAAIIARETVGLGRSCPRLLRACRELPEARGPGATGPRRHRRCILVRPACTGVDVLLEPRISTPHAGRLRRAGAGARASARPVGCGRRG